VTGRKNELVDREMNACVLVVNESNTSQQTTRDNFIEEAIVAVTAKGGQG
jgi:hypothetical protein